jgi:hypothetical protein
MNRHERRKAKAIDKQAIGKHAKDLSVGLDSDMPPWSVKLFNRVAIVSAEGDGGGGDEETYLRCKAIALVLIAHLANIDDDKIRESFIASLTPGAAFKVKEVRDLRAMAGGNERLREVLERMVHDGQAVGVPFPDDPEIH